MTRKNDAKVSQLLDELLKGYQKPEDILGESGVLKQLTKTLIERALGVELTQHHGCEKRDPAGRGSGNDRNGRSTKTLKTEQGSLPGKAPRDRAGTFGPIPNANGETRFRGFDDKIVSMYARGMTAREIQGHLQESYGVKVSPSLISQITEAVSEEVKSWQTRALDAVYPIVYFDALRVKANDNGHLINEVVYLALGIRLDGTKEVLGLWISDTEGAKFWLSVVTELRNRGVSDIFITCVDGLKGLPRAIEAVFPKTQVQRCIVHLVRHSLNYVPWEQRAEMAADLKAIYSAAIAEEAAVRLKTFSAKWDAKHPMVSAIWRRNWEQVTPFFGYPPDIRRVIYTTNAIESINMSLRKVIKTQGSFPNNEAILKLFHLALNNIAKNWTLPISDWKAALGQFSMLFEDRMAVR